MRGSSKLAHHATPSIKNVMEENTGNLTKTKGLTWNGRASMGLNVVISSSVIYLFTNGTKFVMGTLSLTNN